MNIETENGTQLTLDQYISLIYQAGGADLWTFGAPCQDFSIAGLRAGLSGDRSSLVREIFRLLEEQEEKDRPEWLIYENVKGMFSSNHGLDYLSIVSELDRFGYDIEWQNINSAWYVPQNRERIYTVGHLRRYGAAKILPIEGTDGENRIQCLGHREGFRKNLQVFGENGPSEQLDTASGGGRELHVAIPTQFIDMNRGGYMTDKARTITARYTAGFTNHKMVNSAVVMPIGYIKKSDDGDKHQSNEAIGSWGVQH